MIFLTKEDDLKIDKLQSIYFYASWMPYHKKMLIMLDKVEKKHSNIEFIAIDVDSFKTLCKRFSIESVPTITVLKDGKEIKRITGLVLTSAFKSVFADICDSIGDK